LPILYFFNVFILITIICFVLGPFPYFFIWLYEGFIFFISFFNYAIFTSITQKDKKFQIIKQFFMVSRDHTRGLRNLESTKTKELHMNLVDNIGRMCWKCFWWSKAPFFTKSQMQIFQEEKPIKQPNNRAKNNKQLIIPFSKHAYIIFIYYVFESKENKLIKNTKRFNKKFLQRVNFKEWKE